MTKKIELKPIYIEGFKSLLYTADNPYFLSGTGWNQQRRAYKYKSDENATIALQKAIKAKNLVGDEPVYWLFTTVESEHSGCSQKDLENLLGRLSFLTFEKYNESEQFVNSNYFTGNYLKLHIYKVIQK
jgi:hypothetical protein